MKMRLCSSVKCGKFSNEVALVTSVQTTPGSSSVAREGTGGDESPPVLNITFEILTYPLEKKEGGFAMILNVHVT